MEKQKFQEALLHWYDTSKRVLPWRDNPNPYHVWISEIMLQQTRVEAVIPYFHRFLEALPHITDLANVEDDRLNKLWEGLGYYSRARNLKQAAIRIVNEYDGMLPTSRADLESLPGIGPYTAGAIRSIAFEKKDTAVDGNVLRVFARLTAITEDIKNPVIKHQIRALVESLLPDLRIGDFNQALMEIGATVCLPNGTPLCMICPLNIHCEAYQKGVQDQIPIKQKQKLRRIEKRTVTIFKCNNRYSIEQRPPTGLLAGLYQFPNDVGTLSLDEIVRRFPEAISIQRIGNAKHVFSHLEWELTGYLIELRESFSEYLFVTVDELRNTYSVPTAFQSYKNQITGGII